MKRVGVLLLTLVAVGFADEIDELVNKIKLKRESNISKEKLIKIYSPIPKVYVEKNSTKLKGVKDKNGSVAVVVDEEKYVLKGILNNSAYINNRWVRVGEKIGSYTLVEIMDDAVFLKDGNRTKLLFLKSKNNKIKIIGREK
ncbi:MAG: hypothetical protein GXN91_01290 [Epsilonproteobacteria bacterium]|nr:hypothetical protein [Campylobacterota bacterium]